MAMKLSEYKDDEALDVLADLIEPTAFILADKDMRDSLRKCSNEAQQASIVIKTHKNEVMRILAAINGVPADEYHCNLLTLPRQVMEIMNDEDLMDFFKSWGQTEGENNSGSASASTTGGGK